MSFSKRDTTTAEQIVRIFETGRPEGNYAAVTVLDDGAGISYGVSQFTHRSGALAAVVEAYIAAGGTVGRDVLKENVELLKRSTPAAIRKAAANAALKKSLAAAGLTREMRSAQDAVAFERYMRPAIDECARLGFTEPLSLAVVYDSMTHGSWEKIRDRVGLGDSNDERKWILAYVRERNAWLRRVARLAKTAYRTEFFIRQAAIHNWELRRPLIVNGVRLGDETVEPVKSEPAAEPVQPMPPVKGSDDGETPDKNSSTTPAEIQPGASDDGRSHMRAAPAKTAAESIVSTAISGLDATEKKVGAAAARIDQAERIVTTVRTRRDAAKSMWTTVGGSVWQTGWALFGFFSGMPKEVWLVAAIVVGGLTLFYLYRQIELGRIREAGN